MRGGEGRYATGEETAVRGVSRAGYGGRFEGGRGQLLLVPAAEGPQPRASAKRGTLFLDAQATLWLCVAGGTPGTWKRVVVE